MSGFEKEELRTRMQGATEEEQKVIAETLPEDILWYELFRRNESKNEKLRKVEELFKENSPADYQSEQDYK